MKYKIKATRDFVGNIGDRSYDHREGDTIETSAAGVEVALSHLAAGAFELVGEIPETEREKARAKEAAAKEKLSETPKKTLLKQAKKMKIPNAASLNKQPLVDAITDAKESGAKVETGSQTVGTSPTSSMVAPTSTVTAVNNSVTTGTITGVNK